MSPHLKLVPPLVGPLASHDLRDGLRPPGGLLILRVVPDEDQAVDLTGGAGRQAGALELGDLKSGEIMLLFFRCNLFLHILRQLKTNAVSSPYHKFCTVGRR